MFKVNVSFDVNPAEYHYCKNTSEGVTDLAKAMLNREADLPGTIQIKVENKKSLDDLLQDIHVFDPGCWENELSEVLKGWWAVANTEGIIAYFGDQTDAYRFRLSYINRILNP